MKRILYVILSAGIISMTGFAQGTKGTGADDIMWKKKYTRVLDLREKQNQAWMSRGNEISKYLVEGIMSGKLVGYTSDSLINTMTIEQFIAKMTIPGSNNGNEGEEKWDQDELDWEKSQNESTNTDQDLFDEDLTTLSSGPEMYFANQLYILEISEDAIYHKKESRMRYDMQSITLYIPADLPDNLKGVQEHLVTFKYADCVKYFEDLNKFVWFNRSNSREHKGFAKAMDLRLFASTIVKVDNPDDLYLEDQYGSPEKGIIGSQLESFKLMEFEHEMYEY